MITNNERGGALLYVLLIVMLIGILSPVILDSLTSRLFEDRKREEVVLTDQLAISAMESFITYLNNVPADRTDRRTYFNEYPGWGSKTITLPSGKIITLQQYAVDPITGVSFTQVPNDQVYTVLIEATTGTSGEPLQEQKIVRYAVNAVNGSGAIIDENNPIDVGELGEHIFVEGEVKNKPSNTDVTPIDSLQQHISDYMDRLSSQIHNEIDQYRAIRNACNECYLQNLSPNQIQMKINELYGRGHHPVVIEMNNVSINNGDTGVFGSPEIPVVLIVNNINLYRSFTVYGTIITSNINAGNNHNLEVKKVNEAYGDLWGDYQNPYVNINLSNNGLIDVEGIFYGASAQVQNALKLNASQVVIPGTLHINDNQVKVTTDPLNMVVGNLVMMNQAYLDTSGDLLVRDDINTSNNVNIRTGGYIGVGGNVDMKQTTIQTGGGKTVIQIPPGSTGGGAPANNNWNVTRK